MEISQLNQWIISYKELTKNQLEVYLAEVENHLVKYLVERFIPGYKVCTCN